MLIIDTSELIPLGPAVLRFGQKLNEAVGNFVEKPSLSTYESMHDRELQFSAARQVESENIDFDKRTFDVMMKNWRVADVKFKESIKTESMLDLPKTHNRYTESVLFQRSYAEHAILIESLGDIVKRLKERQESLTKAAEWQICVLGLLKENMYMLQR